MDAAAVILRAQRLAGRVDPNYDTRCLEFLTEAVEAWALSQPWPSLRHTASLTTPGGRSLVIPSYFRTVTWVADDTNNRYLKAQDMWERREPSEFLGDTTAAPYWWRERAMSPVFTQPTSAAQISFRTDTSETFSVYIGGISQNTSLSGTAGYEYAKNEIVSIQGSGPATTSGYYVRILTVGKNAQTVSDLQILNGSTEIGRIPSTEKRAEYREIELHPIPTAGQIFRIGGILAPDKILRTTDCPHPSINTQYLVWYVAALIHMAQQQPDKAGALMGQANDIISKRAYQEKMSSERDLGMIPDYDYWNSEDSRSWP